MEKIKKITNPAPRRPTNMHGLVSGSPVTRYSTQKMNTNGLELASGRGFRVIHLYRVQIFQWPLIQALAIKYLKYGEEICPHIFQEMSV